MRNENIADLLESLELILVFQSSICDRHLNKKQIQQNFINFTTIWWIQCN